jgi:hypothetical protein
METKNEITDGMTVADYYELHADTDTGYAVIIDNDHGDVFLRIESHKNGLAVADINSTPSELGYQDHSDELLSQIIDAIPWT